MTAIIEVNQFDAEVYQIETVDPVIGGINGIANLQAKQLANRTKFLKAVIDLLVDGSTVPPGIATQAYVQGLLNLLDNKQSVRATTTANIALAGVQTIDGVVLTVADRVLVKNQNTPAENGIYAVAGSAWARTSDGDASAEMTPGMTAFVEEGTLGGNSRWQLTTDAPIILGTTALAFQDVTLGYAPLFSPALLGTPTAPTPAQFDATTKLATMAALERQGMQASGFRIAGATGAITTADAGGTIFAQAAGAITLTLPSAGAFPAGTNARIEILSGSANPVTVACPAGEGITVNNGAGLASILMGNGDTLTLECISGTQWVAVAGSAQLGSSAAFGSSLSASGWQKLPSGLIEQWALVTVPASTISTFALPFAFPNAFYGVVATGQQASVTSNLTPIIQAESFGLGQVRIQNSYSGSSLLVFYKATGK